MLCDVAGQSRLWEQEFGVDVQWQPLSDDLGVGFWSDVLNRIAAKQRQGFREIVSLLNLDGRFEVTPGGGLVVRPKSIRMNEVDAIFGITKSDLDGRVWVAPPIDLSLPCTSLRIFAQSYVHARLLTVHGFPRVVEGRCSMASLGSEQEAQDCAAAYLTSESTPWGEPQEFRFLWAHSYSREEFLERRKQDPQCKYICARREWMLPVSKEVPLEEFSRRQCVRSLLYLLASPFAGNELVPWCAAFEEEANLVWSMRRLGDRLAMYSVSAQTLDPTVELVLEGDKGRLHFLLACMSLYRHRALYFGEVSEYLEAVREFVRLANRFIHESHFLLPAVLECLISQRKLFIPSVSE
jgi:hypothetical protein